MLVVNEECIFVVDTCTELWLVYKLVQLSMTSKTNRIPVRPVKIEGGSGQQKVAAAAGRCGQSIESTGP
jgi:hypothetical protein